MFAVIYIPEFALQSLLRAEPGLEQRPLVVIDEREKNPRVLQMTAAARAAGIAEGMTSTQALARCTRLGIKSRSPVRERATMDALLQCAYSFSPSIEATADGVCTLDLARLPDLDCEALASEMRQRLALLHLMAQIGIAENPWLALLAARAAQPCRVVTNSTEFLGALPVESIGPAAQTLSILKKWGIHTVGQFVALGKEPLSTRLGPEGIALHVRATANSVRPLRLVRPAQNFQESVEFEHEIETIEPLLFILRRFLEQLLVRLELMYWVAQDLRLTLQFESGQPYERTFRIPAPTGNVETLFRMLHTHLETLRTEHPIIGLQLAATPGRPINHQFGLFESVLRDPNHFHETLARLTALVGADRVGAPVVEETYKADAFRIEPVSLNSFSVAPNSPIMPAPRGPALHRFRPAVPAQVDVANDRPFALKSAVVQSAIEQTRGPWRNSGQWWDAGEWARDEWDVQVHGGRLFRLSRQPHGWFVEGIYD